MGVGCKLFQQSEVLFVRSDYGLHAKLLELLDFVLAPYYDCDVKGIVARMGQQPRKDGATDVS